MAIILVSDIFGKTPALVELAEELNAKLIIDPYSGVDLGFKSEADAYAYFIEHIGFDAYFTLLTKAISSIGLTSLTPLTEPFNTPITLIGFSVGAAAIWRLSALKPTVKPTVKIRNAICYYGSQIRKFTELEPRFNVKLIFPKSEPHFDVLALQNLLEIKPNVEVVNTEHFHGFMNQYSNNYVKTAYFEQIYLLRSSLSEPS
jgi:dienelactone hydrolase